MNPIEQSLNNLAEVSKVIMLKAVERGDLTNADVLFLTMYQKEKSRAVAVPLIQQIIGGIKEVSGILKDVAGAFASDIDAEADASTLQLTDAPDKLEVDTDAI